MEDPVVEVGVEPVVPAEPVVAPVVPVEEPVGLKPDPIDTRVPYQRFREVQTERTHLSRQLEELRPEVEQLRGKSSTLEEQIRKLDAENIAKQRVIDVINGDDELYGRVRERMTERGHTPTSDAAVRRAPPQTVVTRLDDETQKAVMEAANFSRSMRDREEANAVRGRDEATRRELESRVTGLLKKNGYPESTFQRTVPFAMRQIIAMAQSLPGQGDLDDVEHLFAEFHRDQLSLHQALNESVIRGKREDSKVPPSATGGGQPVHVAPEPPPLGSDDVRAQALAFLKRDAGWGA